MTAPAPNGRSLPTLWLLGFFAGLVTLLGGAMLSGARQDVRDLKDQVTELRDRAAVATQDHVRLERIEEKLDRLLEVRK